MDPPSENVVPAFQSGTMSQLIKITNSMHGQVRVLVRILYLVRTRDTYVDVVEPMAIRMSYNIPSIMFRLGHSYNSMD